MPHTTLSGGFLALCRLIERKAMYRHACITVFAGVVLLNTGAIAAPPSIILRPSRVFDGISLKAHEGWVVVVRGERIEAAGPAGK